MKLEEKILQVMGGVHVAAVATVDEGMPAVRFMSLEGYDDMRLVGATMKSSRKVGQIRENPNVALSIWSCGEYTDPYVVIRATAAVQDDPATKKKYWNPMKEAYFQTPDNPEYVVVTFTPKTIEYTDMNGMEVWERKPAIPVAR
ncbi:MAG: pyridoxamine 5'-phosphate oxidase family protein [Methanomicrobiaceae archaeon]|nr:pyridoxamine 5'-phosphate oxidase family protein [Methanomicrobiaceae archaeon]